MLVKLQPRDIIEIGAGIYSTPMLMAYVSVRGGDHLILETNRKYQLAMNSVCGCEMDLFDGETLPPKAFCPWGLAFIDHNPAEARAIVAAALQGWAGVIVLHDSNPEWDEKFGRGAGYGYSKIIPRWKHHKHFTAIDPHTLVLTDSDSVWQALGA